MLSYLHIQDIALIEDLEIEFGDGLNILTGETGAGKSIIIGSIQFILGNKTKKDFIRQGAEAGMAECIFVLDKESSEFIEISNLCEQQGINLDDGELILKRRISQTGRSVFRLNGEVIKQEVMRAVASLIIDIHSQHDHQSLMNQGRQLDLLDKYVEDRIKQTLAELSRTVKELNQLKTSMDEQYLDDEKRRREIAFLEFEMNEIEAAELEIGEDDDLQARFESLSHLKDIVRGVGSLQQDLQENPNVIGVLSEHIGALGKVASYHESVQSIYESLLQVDDVLSMILRDASSVLDDDSSYEEELYDIENRLNTINQLKVKYGNTIDEIIEYGQLKRTEHDYLVNFEEEIIKTRHKISELEKKAEELSATLHRFRQEGGKKLAEQITLVLRDLNLENASFDIELSTKSEITAKGNSVVAFMITTNRGEVLKPLKTVASGGELSRVMLALKSVLASEDGIDTLIFDEIDTGISGHTAQKVAESMNRLSVERQILCITHLPQIASMGDQHFQIFKESDEVSTRTYVEKLSEEDSVMEIGRMLSGAEITEAVLTNARELKERREVIRK